jgi:hypothetical protein
MAEYEIPEPKREEAWFGDGNWCQIIKKKRQKGQDGTDGWLFLFKPSQKTIIWHNLKRGEHLDMNYGFIKRWFPSKDVVVLNDDRAYGRTLIKTDLFGESTNLSNESSDLRAYIETLERLNESLKASLARLHDEYDTLGTQTRLKLKRDADMLLDVRKGAGKIGDEDEGMG